MSGLFRKNNQIGKFPSARNLAKMSKILTGEKFNLDLVVQADEYVYHKINESMRDELIKLLPKSSSISRCVLMRNIEGQRYTLNIKGTGIPAWGNTRRIMRDILNYMQDIHGEYLSLNIKITWNMREPVEEAYIKEDYSQTNN